MLLIALATRPAPAEAGRRSVAVRDETLGLVEL